MNTRVRQCPTTVSWRLKASTHSRLHVITHSLRDSDIKVGGLATKLQVTDMHA